MTDIATRRLRAGRIAVYAALPKGHKAHRSKDTFAHQLGTNLANALRKSGRITEALSFYDDIIATEPTFTMAHFHRGLALLVLEHLSGGRTIALLTQAAREYAIVADAADERRSVRDAAVTMRDHMVKRLAGRGRNADRLQQERQATEHEATQHSPYRKFTLKYHLGLSEHSLYCRCNGGRSDDLMIATRSATVTGDRIPRLELILNRLKAEFGTARLFYYQAAQVDSWDVHDEEITFAELLEGEQVGIRTELLRTSFRLCLGILDKIALAICELYDVGDTQERLYFESFWQKTSRKGKAATRWDTLTARSKNPSLVALYWQATDLRSDGEWALLKMWRNDLEHRFLILTHEPKPPDPWNARQGTFGTRCVTLSEFTDRTLQLLQFARSAIFNFTFCARRETRSHHDGPTVTRTLQPKHRKPE